MKALPFVLFLVAAPPCASAQPFVCEPIRRGDTAARLAVRLTNSAENRHAPWFQILDPATSRFVSKGSYDVIHPGWRVCIARAVIRTPAAPPVLERRAVVLRSWWVWAAGVVALLPAVPATKKYLRAQRAKRNAMIRFGGMFVHEFDRPLPRRHSADRPISVRLRCSPFRARLDILLAPNRGHTYPNVFDHKPNLDYDIQRVLRMVPQQHFVPGEPYARGEWVVIPFQMKDGVSKEGIQ